MRMLRVKQPTRLKEENQGEVSLGSAKARRPWILLSEDDADKAQVAHTVLRFKRAPR